MVVIDELTLPIECWWCGKTFTVQGLITFGPECPPGFTSKQAGGELWMHLDSEPVNEHAATHEGELIKAWAFTVIFGYEISRMLARGDKRVRA